MKDCSRPTILLPATGARAWTVALPRPLGPGSSELVVRVTDDAGQQRERTIVTVVR